MSNISSFTGKFRIPKQTQPVASAKVQRRPRESAVCKQCRISKLRCDRGKPACGNCVKRNATDQCYYDHSVNRRSATHSQNIAEDRLAHLESLVKELMQNQPISKPATQANECLITPAESPEESFEGAIGDAEVGASDQADYVGFTHWSAVLDEIDGLKAEMSKPLDAREETESPAPAGAVLYKESIFGSPELYSLQQIIEDDLPQKVDADRLLALHFQGENFIIPFIHTFHFQSLYHQFWADFSKVNPLWLSILFSIFHLASLAEGSARTFYPADRECLTEASHFHNAASRCLVIGEYHRPQEYVVEALLMYAHCKSVTCLDPQRETGVIHSMAVRSAYQLGYHRDPDHFKGFTPFQGEMRRRTWAVCKQLDLMTSFQLGLPSSICLENCDTKQIRNLRDTDFGPDSMTIPLSRPDEEVTRLLWFVVKDRQMPSFAKVCRNALSHNEKSEAEIVELDQEIRQMHETIPDVCKVRPMSESISDDSFIIITRIYLDFISQKSLCVLHRKYMARGSLFSTVSCLNAGKAIVGQFLEMCREFEPGGRLYEQRWMLGCYTMNDFLLGTTVLCLFIHNQSKKDSKYILVEDVQNAEIIDLLQQAQEICLEKPSASRDAHRVARIVQLTLRNALSINALPRDDRPVVADTTLLSRWEADYGISDAGYQQGNDTAWESDPFGLLQPFSFTDNGMADMDWAVFDPSVSISGV